MLECPEDLSLFYLYSCKLFPDFEVVELRDDDDEESQAEKSIINMAKYELIIQEEQEDLSVIQDFPILEEEEEKKKEEKKNAFQEQLVESDFGLIKRHHCLVHRKAKGPYKAKQIYIKYVAERELGKELMRDEFKRFMKEKRYKELKCYQGN
jgi:hypothetical protein